VLLIILDTVRAANLSLYGYSRATTPALSRWALEGATFDNAFSPAPWTFPSHASMFTGRLPSALLSDWEQVLSASAPTIAEVFRDAGYATAGFVGNMHYTSGDTGLDRGFLTYSDYRTTFEQSVRSTTLAQTEFGLWLCDARSLRVVWLALQHFDLTVRHIWEVDRKPARLVSDEFLTWESNVGRRRPFFAFLNYMDAHEPHTPQPPYDRLFAETPRPIDGYDGSIRLLDDELNRLFRTLRERGDLDSTIVVVASDHGQQFGEHGLEAHGNSLYTQVLWVPLFIRYPPKVPAGARIAQSISLTSIPSTLLDLAGLPNDHFGLRSLAALWRGPRGATLADTVLAEVTAVEAGFSGERGQVARAVIAGALHWFHWFDGVEHLYNVVGDPAETQNLIANPAYRRSADAMRASIPRRGN
jgi:arylsulfatase A-like enzyme